MPYCSFSRESLLYDVTAVPNVFITEYMPHAGGDYVRVYLYGLMLCRYPDADSTLESTAEALGMKPDDVRSAYSYWEAQGLVVRMSDNPPTYQFLPPQAAIANDPGHTAQPEVYQYRDFFSALQDICKDRLLTPAEQAMTIDWVETLKLPQEVVLLLVHAEVDRLQKANRSLKNLFHTLDKKALQWADRDIRTIEKAETDLLRESEAFAAAQAVVNRMGSRRTPSLDEIAMAQRWLEEKQLTRKQILDACQAFTKATSPSFAYLDRVLCGESLPYRSEIAAILRELGAAGTPTQAQSAMYADLLAQGFDADGILYAAQQCSQQNKHSFDSLARKLDAWKREGIFTKQAALDYKRRRAPGEQLAQRMYEMLGLRTVPAATQINAVEEWQRVFPEDVILYAAERAQGTERAWLYIAKLLANWKEKGLLTLDAVKEEAAQFERTQQGRTGGKQLDGQQYTQREYNDEEMRRIGIDISKLPGEDQ